MSALLNNTVTDALAWALLHSLWQFALIGLLVYAFAKLLQTAHQRHFAHLASLLTCGFVFGITAYWYYEPPVEVLVPKGQAFIDFSNISLTATSATKGEIHTLLPYLVPAYLIGLLIIAMRTVIDLTRVRQIRTQLLPATGSISVQFNELIQQFQPATKLQLRLSGAARSAMTIGLFRPLIVFPVGLINQLSTEETEAILLHEIAHLLRNDHWWNAIQVLFGNLFFYHPTVHWLCRRMDAEREYACDDYVVARLDRRVYAQSLLTTAQFSLTHKNQFIMQAQGKSEFTQRIQRLFLTEQDQRRRPRLLMFVPVLLLIIGGFQFNSQGDAEKTLLSDTSFATLESEEQVNIPLDTFPKSRTATDGNHTSIFGDKKKMYFVDGERITPEQSLDLKAALKENPLHKMHICYIEDDPAAMKLARSENKTYYSVIRIYTSEDKVPAKTGQLNKPNGQNSKDGGTNDLDLKSLDSDLSGVAEPQYEQSATPHTKPNSGSSFTTKQGTPIHADLFGAERTYENTVVIINGKRQIGNTLGDLSKLSIESMNVIKGEDRVTAKGYPGYAAMIDLVVNKPGTREPMEVKENLLYLVNDQPMDEVKALAIHPAQIETINIVKGNALAKDFPNSGDYDGVVVIRLKKRKSSTSIQEVLKGKKAGIDIINHENRKIKLNSRNVRGAEDEILYVLDGEVYESGTMDDIDPATISSVEVIKGVEQIAALGFGTEYTGAVLIFTSDKSKRKFDRKQKSKTVKKKEKKKPYFKITGKVADNPNTIFILNGEMISKEQLFKTRQNGEVVTFVTITERSTLEKKGYDSSVFGVIEIIEEK